MNFQVYGLLMENTKSTLGAKVENNKFCLSVHFRCVDEKKWSELAAQVRSMLKDYPKLRLSQGMKMRLAVRDVSNCFPTAIISDMSLEKVFDFVKLNKVYYSGSHGMETMGPPPKNKSYNKNYQQRSFDSEGNEVIIFQPAKIFYWQLRRCNRHQSSRSSR